MLTISDQATRCAITVAIATRANAMLWLDHAHHQAIAMTTPIDALEAGWEEKNGRAVSPPIPCERTMGTNMLAEKKISPGNISGRYTATEKLEAIRRELKLRQRVYRNRVATKRMTPHQAKFQLAIMVAIAADYEAAAAGERLL